MHSFVQQRTSFEHKIVLPYHREGFPYQSKCVFVSSNSCSVSQVLYSVSMAVIFRIKHIALPYHTESQIRVTDGLKGQTEQRKAGTER